MMRSLSSAVAGLRTHQTKMDVIGNNIANVNTYGFKASRTTFQDVYYQNLSGGRTPVDGAYGGTNPTQIGYGSAVATIDILNTQSGMASTDRAMDVYITGDGFLVTQDANGNRMYTRLGNLGFDADGNLCDANGNYVMGFPYHEVNGVQVPNISADGTIEDNLLTNIRIDPSILDQLTGIEITAGGEIVGVLPGDAKITLNSAAPSWFNSSGVTINPDSNFVGSVRLSVYGEFSDTAFNNAMAAINVSGFGATNVTCYPEYALKEPISFSAVRNNTNDVVITMTGQYVNEKGETVSFSASGITNTATGVLHLKDSAGNTIATVNRTPGIATPISFAYNTPDFSATSDWQSTLAGLGLGGFTVSAVSGFPPTVVPPADLTTTITVNSNGQFIINVSGSYNDGSITKQVNATGVLDPTANPTAYVVLTDSDGSVFGQIDINQTVPGTDMTYSPTNTVRNFGYLYQATVKDKGGNVNYFPPNGYESINTTGGSLSLDGISFSFDLSQVSSFNGIIAQIGTTEGDKVNIGCIVLANFRNANGLKQVGSSSYVTSANSGDARYSKPGLGDLGDLMSGALEMSNVDISKEFTDMITTQRGFQANTRIVTVSDEMLQELVNLKR